MKRFLGCVGSHGLVRMSVFAPALLLGMMVGPAISAQDGDQFEGALWKFEMKPVRRGQETLKGMFRVNGKTLYQKETRDSRDWDQVVGHKEFIAKRKTRLVIDDLRANGGKYSGIKGKVVISMDSGGEWSGRMVDSKGAHWKFKCSRVQE